MLDIFLGMIQLDHVHSKCLSLTTGAMLHPDSLCELPRDRTLASSPVLLPSLTYQVGHHETNVNQCNSGRGVAHGDGGRPAPL